MWSTAIKFLGKQETRVIHSLKLAYRPSTVRNLDEENIIHDFNRAFLRFL